MKGIGNHRKNYVDVMRCLATYASCHSFDREMRKMEALHCSLQLIIPV